MKHAYIVKIYRDDNVLCGEIDIARTDGDMKWISGSKLATEIFKSIKRGEDAAERAVALPLPRPITHTRPRERGNA